MTRILNSINRSCASSRLTLFLVLLSASAFFAGRNIGQSWTASGNDMVFIIDELENPDSWILDWLTGPWVGKEMFVYYRPITSLAWWLEYYAFGENQAAWQCVSLLLYLGGVTFLFLLICRIFGAGLPAFLGTAVWAFREKTDLIIQWTPAQTDLLAGFFALSALYFWDKFLIERKQSLLAGALILAILALGSKEVALVLPLVGAALSVFRRKEKWGLYALGCVSLLVLFFVLRTYLLGGIGFVPGDKVGTNAGGIDTGNAIRNVFQFLLPSWIGFTFVSLAGLVILITGCFVYVYRKLSVILLLLIVVVGLGLSTLLIGGFEWWMIPETYLSLFKAIVAFGIFFLIIKWSVRLFLLSLIVGTVFSVFAIRVVFNSAGNVFYLPHLYWALIWATVFTAGLSWFQNRHQSPKILPN